MENEKHGKENRNLLEKKEYLAKSIPELINRFHYRKGPDLYFYKRVIYEVRNHSLESLFKNDYFFELLYATLTSWDMNSRGAKMKYFDEFKENILENEVYFQQLSSFKLDSLEQIDFLQVKKILKDLYGNLNLMKSSGRLVSNSKIMHYILPDLVMPMDRQNTLNFFFGNTEESIGKFLTIIECSYYIAQKVDLKIFLDNEWNRSVPKVIDNAIICAGSLKYRNN